MSDVLLEGVKNLKTSIVVLTHFARRCLNQNPFNQFTDKTLLLMALNF